MKNICIAKADNSDIIGKRETLKTTFFTKNEFATILLVPVDIPSAKKNQGNIPATSQRIKGKSSTGWDLKPTWNTNQKMSMVAVGWMNAQATPNILPRYFCLKSFLVSDHKRVLFCKIAFKKFINYILLHIYLYLSFKNTIMP